jgi:hypothetical protein
MMVAFEEWLRSFHIDNPMLAAREITGFEERLSWAQSVASEAARPNNSVMQKRDVNACYGATRMVTLAA